MIVCVIRLQVVLGVDDVHAVLDVHCLNVSCVADHLLRHCADNERM